MKRFLFRLCLHLGFPHPDYLEKWLNPRQLREWLAWSEIEPFGDQLAGLLNQNSIFWLRSAWLGKDSGKFEDFRLLDDGPTDSTTEGARLMSEIRSGILNGTFV